MNITKITQDAARQDLKIAKKNGSVTICETKLGNVSVEFVDGIFTVTTWGINSEEYCSGNLDKVVVQLAKLYIVE